LKKRHKEKIREPTIFIAYEFFREGAVRAYSILLRHVEGIESSENRQSGHAKKLSTTGGDAELHVGGLIKAEKGRGRVNRGRGGPRSHLVGLMESAFT